MSRLSALSLSSVALLALVGAAPALAADVAADPVQALREEVDALRKRVDRLEAAPAAPAAPTASSAAAPADAPAQVAAAPAAPAPAAKGPKFEAGPLLVVRPWPGPDPDFSSGVSSDPISDVDFGGVEPEKLATLTVADDALIQAHKLPVGRAHHAYDMSGFLPIKTAGAYQLALDVSLDAKSSGRDRVCLLRAFLDGKEVAGGPKWRALTPTPGATQTARLVVSFRVEDVGSAGIAVPAQVVFGCSGAEWSKAGVSATYAPQLKGPGDVNFRPLAPSGFLHRVE